MNAKIAILGLVVTMLIGSASAASIFSEDYRSGYKAGCDLVGGLQHMDGILEGLYMMLELYDTYFDDSQLRSFIEEYNEQVTAYNDLVETTNTITKMVLGDEADDYLIEYRQYYF